MLGYRYSVATAKIRRETIPGILASIRKATSKRREYAMPTKSQV